MQTRIKHKQPSGSDDGGERDVPILVYAPGAVRARTRGVLVETAQVAPSILRLLDLDPAAAKALRSRAPGSFPESAAAAGRHS